jgi:hypothetical protein
MQYSTSAAGIRTFSIPSIPFPRYLRLRVFSAALLLFAMSFGTTVRVIAWFGGSVLLYSRVGFGSSYFYSSALISV